MFSSFKEINMDWNNLVGNFNDFALKVKAFWLFGNLKLGECRYFDKIFYLENQACYLAGSKVKTKDGIIEFQIIISFDKPQDAISMYKNRWQIETAFRALKTAGFNIEDTYLTDIERIEKLLYLVMIAFAWCYNVGEYVHRNIKKITIKKHGRKEKSIFRYGLDIISEFLYESANQYNINVFQFLSCT
jgi:transposase